MGRRGTETVTPEEARAALEKGARESPAWLVSDSVASPFVHPSTVVREDTPQCVGVRPSTTESGAKPPPVILHKSWSPEEVDQGWRRKLPMRSVVWAARAGMGNSIRGLVHTFLFALLSSRQLLISTAGPWGTSIQALFEEFQGGLDRIEGIWVPRVPLYDYRKPDLHDMRPVVQGMPNLNRDDWWYNDNLTRGCAMGALSCDSVWCVRSKIVQLMLGQPRDALGEAIQGSLVVSPMLTTKELLQKHHHSIRILSDFLRWTNPASWARRQLAWGVKHQGQPLQSPSTVVEDAPPAHPALKIKFDVAIHIRTVHSCVEKGSEGRKGCKSEGMEDAYEALKIFPELQEYMTVHRWSCVSHLLAFLLKLKLSQAKGVESGQHHSLSQVPNYQDQLQGFLEESSQTQGTRPKATEALKSDAWTLEDAKAVAAEALGGSVEQVHGTPLGNPQEGLSIFLATDSEAMRPLFVEFLRPFGSVAYSSAGVVHLSFSKGEERVKSKSGTLSEFYLLSRSANIVAFNHRNSTYSEMAALYGNNTLIRGVGPTRCNFIPEHIGSPVGQ